PANQTPVVAKPVQQPVKKPASSSSSDSDDEDKPINKTPVTSKGNYFYIAEPFI
ncbi:unnamed protein product, partial [Rotaria socialis]